MVNANIQFVMVLDLTTAKMYVQGVPAIGITTIRLAAHLTVFQGDGSVSSICGHENAHIMNRSQNYPPFCGAVQINAQYKISVWDQNGFLLLQSRAWSLVLNRGVILHYL
jgi:hypothetical protein